MKILKYPIVILTASFAAGIAIKACTPITLGIASAILSVAIACIAYTYIASARTIKQNAAFGIFACVAFACAGMLSLALHNPLAQPDHYSRYTNGHNEAVITAIVAERLKPNAYAEKYFLDVTRVNAAPATGKLLASVTKDSLHKILHPGTCVVIAAPPQPITKGLNPYSFDYANYMHHQGIHHQVRLKSNFITAGEAHTFGHYVHRFRRTLINSFEVQGYDAVTQNIIKALLFGQRQDMDQATTDSYTKAGVIHVLAISGLHFAVLFFMFNLLLKPLQRGRYGRMVHFLAMMVLLWGFAFVAGLSASVVRSVVMFTFISLGTLLNRQSNNTINSVAVSMLVLLLANPHFLFDVGFQLSYAAVIGILWLHPVLRLPRAQYGAINMVSDMATVSLAAQLGVLPLILYYFNQFPLLFLLANIVVIPLSNVVLVGGIITMLLHFIWMDAALLAGKFLKGCISLMNSAIEAMASIDALVLKDIPFTLPLLLLLYLLVGALAFWLYKKTFVRTAALIAFTFAFHLAYAATSVTAQRHTDALILNNSKASLILQKEQGKLTIYCNDSLAARHRDVTAYNRANFNQPVKIVPLQNLLYLNSRKILTIDSTGICPPKANPDVLVLTGSPRINLERILATLKPRAVVSDATNFKTFNARWKATCRISKIPFHATAEKGFYRIK